MTWQLFGSSCRGKLKSMADASFTLTPARVEDERSWMDLPTERTTDDEFEAGLRAFYG